jgi:hypothetical protein
MLSHSQKIRKPNNLNVWEQSKLNNDQIDERNIWNDDYFLHFCFVFGKDKKSMNKNVLAAIKAL